jgi:hypothetical protein
LVLRRGIECSGINDTTTIDIRLPERPCTTRTCNSLLLSRFRSQCDRVFRRAACSLGSREQNQPWLVESAKVATERQLTRERDFRSEAAYTFV